MLILTDVDDTLLDWLKGFKKFIYAKEIKTHTEHPTNWDLKSWLLDHEPLPLIEEFNQSPHFKMLEPFYDAQSVIPKLLNLGHKVLVVSSCGDHPYTQIARKENLESCFGKIFTGIECLKLGESKSDYLASIPSGWWIEDRHSSAVDGHLAGHKAIILDRPYNREDSIFDIPRCKDWYEIFAHITMN